jgi:DNA-binding PadR family transcriptional regulator
MDFSKKLTGSTTATLILAVIAENGCHGYEVVKRVNELSDGAFR